MQIMDYPPLTDIKMITPKSYKDDRGEFYESYSKQWFPDIEFVQANHVHSNQGVIRGLHYQAITPTSKGQIKLVRVTKGEILDIAVDIRRDSPTLGQWIAAVLSAENRKQLLIPLGFAHGYRVLSETAEVQYLCSNVYNGETESGIKWDDPDLAIAWFSTDIEYAVPPKLSARDLNNPSFSEYLKSDKQAI